MLREIGINVLQEILMISLFFFGAIIISNCKIKKKRLFFWYTISFCFSFISLIIHEAIETLIVLVCIKTMLHREAGSINKSCFYAFLSLTIAYCTSVFVDVVFYTFLISNIIIIVAVKIIIYLAICILIQKQISVLKNKRKNQYKNLELIFLVPIIVVFIVIFILEFISNEIYIKYYTVAFIITSIATLILYIIMKDIIYRKKIENQKVVLGQLQHYILHLESLYLDMRDFKIDYANILTSLKTYIETENYEGMKKYFDQKLLPVSNRISEDPLKITKLSKIKVNEVKGLLSIKIIQAQKEGIDIYIDIMEEIDFISLNSVDLCRGLGILMDNAIEETKLCKVPKIEIGLIKENDLVVIMINNNCREEVPPVFKIYEKGFSTKGDERGLGLATLKEIVSKNKNTTLDTVIEDNQFKQTLHIVKNN